MAPNDLDAMGLAELMRRGRGRKPWISYDFITCGLRGCRRASKSGVALLRSSCRCGGASVAGSTPPCWPWPPSRCAVASSLVRGLSALVRPSQGELPGVMTMAVLMGFGQERRKVREAEER